MKALKLLVIALVAIFTFGTAEAQVVVKARIGDRPHRRVVVVHHHYRHHHYYHHR